MSQSIKSAAIRLLARRDHSAAELKNKLQARGFELQNIEEVIAILMADNLLNEYRFAESYCLARSTRGFGPLAIQNELKLKNVDKQIIQKALAELNMNWGGIAKKVLQKKYANSFQFTAQEKAKCWRFLTQRGFAHEHINAVFKDS